MRIALMTLGTRGDVQPFVELGRGLREAGYQVRLATGSGFSDMVAAAGLDYAPMDVDFAAMMADPQAQAALRGPIGLVRFWRQAGGLVRRMLDESADAASGADAIIHHPKVTAGAHLSERFGLPRMVAALQPILAPTAAFPSPILPVPDLGAWGNRQSHRLVLSLMASGGFPGVLANWRAQRLGLPPRAAQVSAPVLYGFSPTLVPRPPDWDDRVHVTGAWFGCEERRWTPPEALARFLAQGQPPVYVGFGSMAVSGAAERGEMVLAALAQAGLRGVVASGWGGLAAQSTDHVHVVKEVPHAWLFPRCAAVVHHGGAGTTQEALRWGRPSLVCPVFGDQPFWGRRVAALGAGPPPIPLRRLSSERLARALTDLTTNSSYARAASTLGEALRRECGVRHAVSAVAAEFGQPRA